MHLQHTRHQLSLNGPGLRGLDVNSVISSSDSFAYLHIPASETTFHQKKSQLRIELTFEDRLWNPTAKMSPSSGSRGCKACVDYCCFIGSTLQKLCCRSCIRLWHSVSWARGFSDFLGVCSNLSRSQSPCDLRHVPLRPLEHWGRGFESQSRHGCLSAFIGLCVVVCISSGLETGWSLVQEVLPTVYRIKKLYSGQGSRKSCRAIDR
jgi:hypothetical protein